MKAMTPEQHAKQKAYQRDYQKKWVRLHRTKVLEMRKLNRARTTQARSVSWKDYYAKHRERLCAKARERSRNNRTHINARKRSRYVNDISFRMATTLRTRMSVALKAQKIAKTSLFYDLVGCSKTQLVIHIQNLFSGGMSWDNYGQWHIDHKLPCAVFDLSKVHEQKRCFHFSNLQPLWAADNYRKSDKV